MNISVIIPTYNRLDFLSRAIDSVVQQTFTPAEIIIIDDGSTDKTRSIVKKQYPDVNYVYQENKGVSAARNNGIALAKYSWIAFLDSDDRWHRDKLRIQSDVLAACPEYKICHSNEIWIKSGKRINQKKKHQKRGGDIFRHCLPLCVISPSSVLLHRDIFREIGVFDETLPACEDYDLWLRICAKYPILYVKDELVEKYGGHKDQLSMKYWGMDRFRIQAMKNLLANVELNHKQKYLVNRALNTKINIFLKGARKYKNTLAEKEYKSLIQQLT